MTSRFKFRSVVLFIVGFVAALVILNLSILQLPSSSLSSIQPQHPGTRHEPCPKTVEVAPQTLTQAGGNLASDTVLANHRISTSLSAEAPNNDNLVDSDSALTRLKRLVLPRHNKYLPAMTADSPSFVSELPPGGFMKEYKSFCWRPNTGEVTCLPHAFIGGFPKCGTTDLYDKLVWHPDILLPPAGKENHYFARTRVGRHVGLTQRGATSKGTLLSYSKRMTPAGMEAKQNAVILDGTPTLLDEHIGWEKRFPWAYEPPYTNADMLYYSTPQAKVVAMVRDPTDRLWSDYLYFDRHDNRTPEHFRTQVSDQIAWFNKCLERGTLRQCCFTSDNSIIVQLHKGIYVCYLQDWVENFRDNLLVLTMEEYSVDQLGTLRRVYELLGVEVDLGDLEGFLKLGEVKNSRTKERVAKGDMLGESRELVEEFYRPYNRMLAEYLQDEKFLFRDSY